MSIAFIISSSDPQKTICPQQSLCLSDRTLQHGSSLMSLMQMLVSPGPRQLDLNHLRSTCCSHKGNSQVCTRDTIILHAAWYTALCLAFNQQFADVNNGRPYRLAVCSRTCTSIALSGSCSTASNAACALAHSTSVLVSMLQACRCS